jgi:hypothetical protein
MTIVETIVRANPATDSPPERRTLERKRASRSGAPGGAPWRQRTYDSSRTAGVGTDSGGWARRGGAADLGIDPRGDPQMHGCRDTW